jgi:hypothetical protein
MRRCRAHQEDGRVKPGHDAIRRLSIVHPIALSLLAAGLDPGPAAKQVGVMPFTPENAHRVA